jgi:hypothetical protein
VGGVDRLLEAAEPDPTLGEAGDSVDQVSTRWRRERPRRSSFQTTRVSPGVAWAQLVQDLLEDRAVAAGAAGGFGEHPVATGMLEGVDLEAWLLVGGGDAGVVEQMSHAGDGCRTL